jgi:hypothetical protein
MAFVRIGYLMLFSYSHYPALSSSLVVIACKDQPKSSIDIQHPVFGFRSDLISG